MTDFDLIIIGGGINGAGVARDASMRGLKVLLLDKNDFASGTSSRSTKLIHGGIRYLENYDFKLVWEACHERKTLTEIASHLVKTLPFVIPVYKGDKRPAWLVKLGMFLYDVMAGFKNIHRHKNLSATQILKIIPSLKKEGLKGGGIYYDCQTDDSRLVLANIQDAVRHGATVKNYLEVVELHASETPESARAESETAPHAKSARAPVPRGVDFYAGKVAKESHFADSGQDGKNSRPEDQNSIQVSCRDTLTGKTSSYTGKFVVNATGPWLDLNLKKWHINEQKQLRLTKGIHFFIPKLTDEYALLISTQHDNRIFFVIPHGEYSLVGTTDTDYQKNPDEVSTDESDIEYLLTELKRLFPHKNITRKDIFADYAGLRPLLHVSGVKEGKVTREYKLKEDKIDSSNAGTAAQSVVQAATMISVVGGKITTYRNLAEKVTDLVMEKIHNHGGQRPNTQILKTKCSTAQKKLPGSEFQENFEVFKRCALAKKQQLKALDPDIAKNLLNTYGSEIDKILPYLQWQSNHIFQASNSTQPNTDYQYNGATRIIPNLPIIWAQLYYGIDHEFIRTAEDFIRRRTELYIHIKDNSEIVQNIISQISVLAAASNRLLRSLN